MSVSFRVEGTPAAQGSMKHVGNGRMVSMAKGLPKWRKAIVAAAQEAHGTDWEPIDEPVAVVVHFFLRRPKKTKFPDFPAGTPDLDKLQRAIGDALKIAGTITDDARIVSWSAHKHWAIGTEPAAMINIYPKTEWAA
jgi:crossover junction endodeoxyribonuclease RusA